MRHVLLALLVSLGLAVSVQTLKALPSPDLAGLVGVAGHHVTNDELTGARSRLWCHNLTSVTGKVISPKIIQMDGIVCGDPMGTFSQTFGDSTDEISRDGFRNVPSARRGDNSIVTMNVKLARPEDAQKMLPGKVVTLSGVFSLVTTNRGYYLIADNAKYLHDNPFGR